MHHDFYTGQVMNVSSKDSHIRPSIRSSSISSMAQNSDLDLTSDVLGKLVPATSPTVTWHDGHITVLPAVYDKFGKNVCEAIDIPIIKFMAEFPVSTSESSYIAHVPHTIMSRDGFLERVGHCLSLNKSVVIRGAEGQHDTQKLSADYLERNFAISPHRTVCIHGICSLSSSS
jgi:hypothetical protein